MSKWLRRGDRVVVVAGNEKGKSGKVLRRLKHRVLVEGLNIRKKHMRRTQESPQGQILSFEGPMHISNVRPCDGEGKPVRLRLREQDGKRELIYHEGSKSVVYRTVTKAG